MKDYLIVTGVTAGVLDTILQLLGGEENCPDIDGGQAGTVVVRGETDFFDLPTGGAESGLVSPEALTYCPNTLGVVKVACSLAALVGTAALGALVTAIERSPRCVKTTVILAQGTLFMIALVGSGLAYQDSEVVNGVLSVVLFTIQSALSRIAYKYRPPPALVQLEDGLMGDVAPGLEVPVEAGVHAAEAEAGAGVVEETE